ncbi:LysR family transcriptional regulator [Achromobacter sp. F4_2707]|uniref:LysR family transcriptional regulator n=1 Tax=Achromobacter sp. F4_2707 TaxID=3114286 RepID=UPI0039C60CC8
MSAAARHLGVTRSQVSRNLKKLERDMGAQLIRRTTRRLELTQQGMLLYEHGICKTLQGHQVACTVLKPG